MLHNIMLVCIIMPNVRLLYMTIVYFPFLDLYSLAYKPLSCTCKYTFDIYKDSSLSSWYQSGFSDFFFYSLLLLSRSRHYRHCIAHFSREHHCLLIISYLRKSKTEVTGHSNVNLVKINMPVCSR